MRRNNKIILFIIPIYSLILVSGNNEIFSKPRLVIKCINSKNGQLIENLKIWSSDKDQKVKNYRFKYDRVKKDYSIALERLYSDTNKLTTIIIESNIFTLDPNTKEYCKVSVAYKDTVIKLVLNPLIKLHFYKKEFLPEEKFQFIILVNHDTLGQDPFKPLGSFNRLYPNKILRSIYFDENRPELLFCYACTNTDIEVMFNSHLSILIIREYNNQVSHSIIDLIMDRNKLLFLDSLKFIPYE